MVLTAIGIPLLLALAVTLLLWPVWGWLVLGLLIAGTFQAAER